LIAQTSFVTPLQQWVGEKTGLLSSLNPHTLEQYQFLRLREQLYYARSHSPYYSRRLQGLDIERITGRSSLPLLPFTPGQALREEPQKLLCISGGEAQRVTTLNTSGSSGDTKRVWFSPSDLDRTVEFFARGMATMVGPGKTALVLLSGNTPDSLGDLLGRALSSIGVKAVIHGPVREMEAALDAIGKADCIVGLPVHLNRLCLCAKNLRPATVLLTADYVPQGIIDTIRNIWGSDVFTHYGMTESGFGLAVQCHSHEALHLRDAEFIIEIVDPASGQPLPDGEWGELVLSSLCNEAMPLIRYRTGDITRRIIEPCPCGGILPRLDKVRGRISGIAQEYPIHRLDEALFLLPGMLDYHANMLGDNGLNLTLDGLSDYSEEEIRRALRTQGLTPPVLKFRNEVLPVFGGPAKRKIWGPETGD
jgi:phenylacetate-coenzyme A ligase PaaK-like adenylate-forming protein